MADRMAQLAEAPVAGANVALASSSGDVNWLTLLALLFFGVGAIMMAASVIGASAWYGSGPERRAWAGRHLAYGITFATLSVLAGLILQALSLFQSLSFGPAVVAVLAGLPVLLVVYLFGADAFCEHRSQLYSGGATGDGERLEDLLAARRTLHRPLTATMTDESADDVPAGLQHNAESGIGDVVAVPR